MDEGRIRRGGGVSGESGAWPLGAVEEGVEGGGAEGDLAKRGGEAGDGDGRRRGRGGCCCRGCGWLWHNAAAVFLGGARSLGPEGFKVVLDSGGELDFALGRGETGELEASRGRRKRRRRCRRRRRRWPGHNAVEGAWLGAGVLRPEQVGVVLVSAEEDGAEMWPHARKVHAGFRRSGSRCGRSRCRSRCGRLWPDAPECL